MYSHLYINNPHEFLQFYPISDQQFAKPVLRIQIEISKMRRGFRVGFRVRQLQYCITSPIYLGIHCSLQSKFA